MSDKEIEVMIQEKRLNAPRVTPERIEQVIAKEEYFRLTGTLTVCVLTLANGFTVTGESACASPENFNEEIGNRIARDNAKNKIWALEGYLLRQKLHEDEEGDEIELKINQGSGRPAYQVRVIEEKSALDEKLGKLRTFLESDVSSAANDRALLVEQANAMGIYSAILGQRIQGFDM